MNLHVCMQISHFTTQYAQLITCATIGKYELLAWLPELLTGGVVDIASWKICAWKP